MASQSRAAKHAWKRIIRLACRVFQLRRRAAELFELRERGVEVGLVEEFAAVDQATFDCHEFDDSPLGVEARLARSLATTWVKTAPRSFS